jgi:predicted nuclease of predicted toxin-antitoxin system
MPVAFYMNEHIPKPITIALRLWGVDVLTAQENGHDETDDSILVNRANELRRVMFSFDADMLREAARRQREGIAFAGLGFASKPMHSV